MAHQAEMLLPLNLNFGQSKIFQY
eukprot:COSAG05_NODE_18208_length_312_cov_0.708920_1_plen_23_part_10